MKSQFLLKYFESLTLIYNSLRRFAIDFNIPNILRAIFMALPKKARAIECKLYCTNSLMSPITKTLLKITLMRVRSKIRLKMQMNNVNLLTEKGL